MPKLNSTSIIALLVVAVAVVGGIYLYLSGGLPQLGGEKQTGQQGEQAELPEVLSIAGRVTSVNVDENSFVLLQPKEERSFTVKLGEETEFIRLIFPFDLNNPPATDVSFIPDREVVTIEDLHVGDQVFARADTPIKTGQDITNPLEIQILP